MSEDDASYIKIPSVPEGAIMTEGLVAVMYVKSDGTVGFQHGYIGEGLATSYIGLLEMVKHRLLSGDADPV